MKVDISDLVKVLLENYPVSDEQVKPENPIELIIKTILHNQINSHKFLNKAIENLKTQFKDWKDVLEAPDWRIAMAIRDVGYSNKKTIYIKNFLRFVQEHNWDLSWIKKLSIDEAVKVLKGIKGIPSKDVRYILSFGFDMPVFPTDPHVKRVIRRIGILGNSATEEQISRHLESIPNIPYRKLYYALLQHANTICAARKPKCLVCPIARYCHSVSPSVEYIQSRRVSP